MSKKHGTKTNEDRFRFACGFPATAVTSGVLVLAGGCCMCVQHSRLRRRPADRRGMRASAQCVMRLPHSALKSRVRSLPTALSKGTAS